MIEEIAPLPCEEAFIKNSISESAAMTGKSLNNLGIHDSSNREINHVFYLALFDLDSNLSDFSFLGHRVSR